MSREDQGRERKSSTHCPDPRRGRSGWRACGWSAFRGGSRVERLAGSQRCAPEQRQVVNVAFLTVVPAACSHISLGFPFLFTSQPQNITAFQWDFM